MDTVWDMGITIIAFLQGLGEWLTTPMKLATSLGVPEFYMLFMPALYWCWDARLGLRVALILMLSTGLNNALKIALHSPRPYWITSDIKALSNDLAFGLPSGHAQHGVAVWGLLATSVRRPWAWRIALALVVLIGVSRVYLGVHFPTDVLCGWLVGGLLLWLFLRWGPKVRAWLRRFTTECPVWQQALMAFLASLVLAALAGLSLASLGDWRVPEAWPRIAWANSGKEIDPLSLSGVFSAAGLLFGLGAGLAWISRGEGFRADGPAAKRIGRYLVGLVGVILLWYGLRAIRLDHNSLSGHFADYARAALGGAWISAGAPWLFLRLGLAERQPGHDDRRAWADSP